MWKIESITEGMTSYLPTNLWSTKFHDQKIQVGFNSKKSGVFKKNWVEYPNENGGKMENKEEKKKGRGAWDTKNMENKGGVESKPRV